MRYSVLALCLAGPGRDATCRVCRAKGLKPCEHARAVSGSLHLGGTRNVLSYTGLPGTVLCHCTRPAPGATCRVYRAKRDRGRGEYKGRATSGSVFSQRPRVQFTATHHAITALCASPSATQPSPAHQDRSQAKPGRPTTPRLPPLTTAADPCQGDRSIDRRLRYVSLLLSLFSFSHPRSMNVRARKTRTSIAGYRFDRLGRNDSRPAAVDRSIDSSLVVAVSRAPGTKVSEADFVLFCSQAH